MAGAPVAAVLRVLGADFYRAFPLVSSIVGKSCYSAAKMSDFAEKSA